MFYNGELSHVSRARVSETAVGRQRGRESTERYLIRRDGSRAAPPEFRPFRVRISVPRVFSFYEPEFGPQRLKFLQNRTTGACSPTVFASRSGRPSLVTTTIRGSEFVPSRLSRRDVPKRLIFPFRRPDSETPRAGPRQNTTSPNTISIKKKSKNVSVFVPASPK